MNAMTEPLLFKQGDRELVSFATAPLRLPRTGRLAVDGDVARLKLDVDEDGGIKPGYKLKLNSLRSRRRHRAARRAASASASSIPKSTPW